MRRSLAPALVAVTAAATLAGCASAAPHPRSAPPARAAAAAATQWTDWYAYHLDGHRLGYSPTQPAPRSTPSITHDIALDGQVYASPLVVKGVTIVATENNTVYAFDPSYRQLWKRHLGTPTNNNEHPCGNIDPLGITGTPSFAGATNSVYVAATLSGSPLTHRLYSINFSTGAVRWNKSLDFSGVDQKVMQQRGALLTTASGVYVPFGGLAGDCGNYKGRVVRYSLTGSGTPSVYTVPTTREAGIWTPPGLVNDGTNLYAAVGNGEAGAGDAYDHSDSILKFTSALKVVDYFAPANWASENAGDVDLGSQGPALVGPWVFSAGKSGTAYVLRRSNLGGIGKQVNKASVCKSFGGTAVVGSTVYVPCTDGVRAVSINSSGTMKVLWHAASNITGSPVVGGTRVWTLDPNGGTLYGLDPATGKVLSSTKVGATTRFATPALYGHHVVVGTTRGVVVVNYS